MVIFHLSPLQIPSKKIVKGEGEAGEEWGGGLNLRGGELKGKARGKGCSILFISIVH